MYGNQVNLGLGAMMAGGNGLGYVGDLRNASQGYAEPPSSPIMHALSGCSDASSSLHDRISILENRLSMLLGQESPIPTNTCMDKAPAPASELAGRLSDVSGNLWVAVARLENLTARLTV